jgi:hypothetical protein
MSTVSSPSFSFVLVFLLLSLLFSYNTYKLWFKTDAYYEEIYTSLTNQSSIYPFRDFFLRRVQNKKRWVTEQKIYSAIGLIAVIVADVMIIAAWMNSR